MTRAFQRHCRSLRHPACSFHCPAHFGAQGAQAAPRGLVLEHAATSSPMAGCQQLLLCPAPSLQGSCSPWSLCPPSREQWIWGGWRQAGAQRDVDPCQECNYSPAGALTRESRALWGAGEAEASVCWHRCLSWPCSSCGGCGELGPRVPLALVPLVFGSLLTAGLSQGSSSGQFPEWDPGCSWGG